MSFQVEAHVNPFHLSFTRETDAEFLPDWSRSGRLRRFSSTCRLAPDLSVMLSVCTVLPSRRTLVANLFESAPMPNLNRVQLSLQQVEDRVVPASGLAWP